MNYQTFFVKSVVLFTPEIHKDDRGYFLESYKEVDLKAARGWYSEWIQDNMSYSKRGTVRGLHFQKDLAAQNKLVSCLEGTILDVIVDLRAYSPTFGSWKSFQLDSITRQSLFVPVGFAHGFSVLSDHALIQYKVDRPYTPEMEDGLAFDDPELNIDWKIKREDMILSEKDLHRPSLKDCYKFE